MAQVRPKFGCSHIPWRTTNLPLVQRYRRPINHISEPPFYRSYVRSLGNLPRWR